MKKITLTVIHLTKIVYIRYKKHFNKLIATFFLINFALLIVKSSINLI